MASRRPCEQCVWAWVRAKRGYQGPGARLPGNVDEASARLYERVRHQACERGDLPRQNALHLLSSIFHLALVDGHDGDAAHRD